MALSVKSKPYIIPEYSLTGDLLSYKTCGLQYRYHNRGALPPSTPVQLWFGEFIHGVMEEAYKHWKTNPATHRFPWSWEGEIREIEMNVNRRLKARGLLPPPPLFCPYDENAQHQGACPDANHPHKRIASQRAEAAINIWGQHLFPLITDAEVKLKGFREIINYQEGIHRSNYYGITGIVDVLTHISLQQAPAGNLILHYIKQNSEIQKMINELETANFEIIIDYKGMRRPPVTLSDGKCNITWDAHEWQILTYAWLRSRQTDAHKPIAGIIFYLNEMVPSAQDDSTLYEEIMNEQTDIKPSRKVDLYEIEKWKKGSKKLALSSDLREERAIRLIPITELRQTKSLEEFDKVVYEIEEAIIDETNNGSIQACWKPNFVDKTCTACDFKYYCPAAKDKYKVNVP